MSSVKSILYGTTASNLVFPVLINDNNNIITTSSIIPPNGQVLLGSEFANAVQADSSPDAIADPQNRAGWYYNNSGGNGEKFNWYFYSGIKHGYTVADLRLITATVSLDNPSLKPFFVMYTKNGSKRIYETDELLIEGQKVLFFFGETGYEPQNNDQLRLVRLVPTQNVGVVTPEMQIAAITMHSDSSFAKGQFGMCCENVGFRLANLTLNYTLATPNAGGSSSNVSVVATVSTPITNAKIDKLSFTNDNLLKVVSTAGTVQGAHWTQANFTNCVIDQPLPIGSVSSSIPFEGCSQLMVWGSGVKADSTSMATPSITVQCSTADDIFVDTVFKGYLSGTTSFFTILETLPVKSVRLVVRDAEVASVKLNVSYK